MERTNVEMISRPLTREKVERADKLFRRDFCDNAYGGMSVGIVQESKLVWSNSYGWADVEREIKATADTIYRIGSITKQFTSVLLLQLIERQLVDLKDPVEKYYPNIRQVKGWPLKQPITLEDLATHRSALAQEPDGCQPGAVALFDRGCEAQIGPASSWDEILAKAMPSVSFLRETTGIVTYSNIGIAVLGALIAKITNRSFIDLATENLFEPLGMKDTTWEPRVSMLPTTAKGYVKQDGNLNWTIAVDELWYGRGYKIPNGSAYSTVSDMAKFVSFMMGCGPQVVLGHETLKENMKRSYDWFEGPGSSIQPLRKNATYGIGLQQYKIAGHAIMGHIGASAGYAAAAFYEPNLKVGVICMRNSHTAVSCWDSTIDALVALVE